MEGGRSVCCSVSLSNNLPVVLSVYLYVVLSGYLSVCLLHCLFGVPVDVTVIFQARLPPFSEPFHAADSPMSFWQRLTSSAGIELRQLAVRLLAISPVTVIAGPEWNAAALASSLRVMPPEAVAKAIQLQHFYHVNAADEFHDVQTVFGSASNQEKLLDIVKTDEDMGHLKDAGEFPCLGMFVAPLASLPVGLSSCLSAYLSVCSACACVCLSVSFPAYQSFV